MQQNRHLAGTLQKVFVDEFLIIPWIKFKNCCRLAACTRTEFLGRMTYLMHAAVMAIKGFVWNVLQSVMFFQLILFITASENRLAAVSQTHVPHYSPSQNPHQAINMRMKKKRIFVARFFFLSTMKISTRSVIHTQMAIACAN